MKLFEIKATMFGRNDDASDFFLTLEGDASSAEDGDWTANGGAAPLLNSQDGSWKLVTIENDAKRRTLLLWDGPLNEGISIVWRSMPNSVAALIIPEDFPKMTAAYSTGFVRWEGGQEKRISWRLVRSFV